MTSKTNSPFSSFLDAFEEKKRRVWIKAAPIPGRDPALWRRDAGGAILFYPAFGEPTSPWAWAFAAIVDPALGGDEDVANLRPVHWRRRAGSAAPGGLPGPGRGAA